MINNLQVLRAFAAINVVYFHIIVTSATYDVPTQRLSFLEGWGENGVDLFFVISGFVMLHTQMQKKRNTWDFMVSRLIRIVPAYWFITTLVLVLFILFPHIFRATTPTPLWITTSYLFMSRFITGMNPLVYVGWTLEWEMLFYIVFGVSLLFKTWTRSIVFVLTVLCSIVIFSNNMIIFEFFFGMLAAWAFNRVKIGVISANIIWGVGAFLLATSLNATLRHAGIGRVAMWGVPSLMVLFGAINSKQIKAGLLTYIGDASYSIYLAQMLTIPAFYKMTTILSIPGKVNNDILSVLCLAASVLFGIFMYAAFEKPFTNTLRNRLMKRPGRSESVAIESVPYPAGRDTLRISKTHGTQYPN